MNKVFLLFALLVVMFPYPASALAIVTRALPDAVLGDYYEEELITGGAVPAAWSIADGNLPSGLRLSGCGKISGIPEEIGEYRFVVKAENSEESVTKTFMLYVFYYA